MKTARFKTIVEKTGRPRIYFQFLAADEDSELQEALKKNRVLSVNQMAVGQRKDFGTVGYEKDTASQILIFPRSLAAFKGCKIIGLDYALLDEPVGPKTTANRTKSKPSSSPIPVPVPTPGEPPAPIEKPSSLSSKLKLKVTRKPRKAAKEKVPPSSGHSSHEDLKTKLEEVLTEWDRGHDVRANKMLSAIVQNL